MGEPPAGLDVEVDLDGVVVRMPRPGVLLPGLLSVGAVTAGGVVTVIGGLLPGLVVAGLGTLWGLATVLRSRKSTALHVDERWLTLRKTDSLGAVTQVRFPLEQLDKMGVVPPKSELYQACLYLRSGDTKIRFGEGLDEAKLQWVHGAIEEARVVAERRVRAAGKEYNFEKVAPAEVVELIER